MQYSFAEYVAALRWFGWKQAKAEQIAQDQTLVGGYDHLVREYKRHTKEEGAQ